MSFRVGIIISSFRPVIGGAERVTEEFAKELAKNGADVLIFTRRYSSQDLARDKKDDVVVYRLGYPTYGKFGALTFALHTLLILLKEANRISIVHIHNTDTPALLGILAKLMLRKKVVATIHGEAPIFARKQTLLGSFRMRLMAFLFDAFTAMNPANEAALGTIGVSCSRIHAIPNGVDQSVFHPPSDAEKRNARTKFDFKGEQRIALYIGRLVSWKRVDILLEAWALLKQQPRWQLVIVGTGSEESALKELAKELNIDVRFEGASNNVHQYLNAADLFILPSGEPETNSYEGMSTALLEAMSCGLPVIVAECPGNCVLVKHEQTGLMFTAGNVTSLASQLQRAVADQNVRFFLGKAAYAEVSGKYTINNTVLKTKEVYEKILFIS